MANSIRKAGRQGGRIVLAAICLGAAWPLAAQGVTGALIGRVTDAQGAVIPGATVRLESSALIGGPAHLNTDERGQLRFPLLPPGSYSIRVERDGFATYLEDAISVGAGRTIELDIRLRVGTLSASLVVDGSVTRADARNPGFSTRYGPEDLQSMPARRASMFDVIRASPGISPTSPSSATSTTVSAFGSGTNENAFLIDDTNFTCPCNGVARSEPGVDFIQEVHVQSAGASAEFGSVQGAVINVVMKQGGERWRSDLGYYSQTGALTSAPVRLPIANAPGRESSYARSRYRDFSATGGGPAIRNRLWVFGGYQYLRDYDSQPGAVPETPRRYEQDKAFAKLTWQLAPGWRLMQSAHAEFWENPEQPTMALPFASTLHRQATVPAATLGHLTRATDGGVVWDMRVGHFTFAQKSSPITGDLSMPNRVDNPGNLTSGGSREFGELTIRRTTAKITMSRFAALAGASHEWKAGLQLERGAHDATSIMPAGVRYIYNNGSPQQSISMDPSNTGATSVTASAFVSDSFSIGERLTISAGLRFDHSRAISPDLPAVDLRGRRTDREVAGLGLLYRWNLFSPRLGTVMKITSDGRTLVRASYGRFHAGVLTGELSSFHPGESTVTTRDYVAADGGYTSIRSTLRPGDDLRLDSGIRSPYTDELSVGADRQFGGELAVAVAYVRKDGRDFVGWSDIGGEYVQQTRTLADGRVLPVQVLTSSPDDRLFLLTNPEGYSVTYDGVVIALEKRRRNGWQAFGSYTYSRVSGLQAASGTTAAGPQVTTVAPPPANGLIFGQNPNDLTNARGRLPNDRPHVLRLMTSFAERRTGLLLAAHLQHFSGKPWAASAQVSLEGTIRRILLEPRGSRRLSSQSLLDVRLSRGFRLGAVQMDLMLDVLNLLDDAAEESLVSDVLLTQSAMNPTFARPNVFMDPRRAMLSARLGLGR